MKGVITKWIWYNGGDKNCNYINDEPFFPLIEIGKHGVEIIWICRGARILNVYNKGAEYLLFMIIVSLLSELASFICDRCYYRQLNNLPSKAHPRTSAEATYELFTTIIFSPRNYISFYRLVLREKSSFCFLHRDNFFQLYIRFYYYFLPSTTLSTG